MASFGFDGDTASTAPRAVMALADLVHVTAGAVRAGELAVRFLRAASAAAAAVGVWRTVMLFTIIDDADQLLSTL